MLNTLKKIPILESIIILIVNVIAFFIGVLEFIPTFLLAEDNISEDAFVKLINGALFDVSCLGVIVCIYILLFNYSLNKTFLKAVCNFKNNKKSRICWYIILLLFSPLFLLSLLTFSPFCIHIGCCFSCVFPVVLFDLYSRFTGVVLRRSNKIFMILNVVIFILLIFLMFLFIYQYNNIWGHNIIVNALIFLLASLLIISKQTNIIIEYIMQSPIFLFFLLCYVYMIYCMDGYYLRFYAVCFLSFLVFIFLFGQKILKIKSKNCQLREEIEAEVNLPINKA